MKSLHVNGKPVSDDASRVCVLYEPKSGRVVHVHGVTVLPGGKEVSKDELERRAVARAKSLGRSVAGLKTLHVPVAAIRQRGTLKVNSKGTALVTAWEPPTHMRDLFAQRRKPSTGSKVTATAKAQPKPKPKPKK